MQSEKSREATVQSLWGRGCLTRMKRMLLSINTMLNAHRELTETSMAVI